MPAALQDKYLSNLGVLKGMLAEIEARRYRLRQKLRSCPDKASEISKELGFLEGELDAIMISVDFVLDFDFVSN